MMRCKKHLSDLSSTKGVCASCLRLRLFALLAVQSQALTQPENDYKPPSPLTFPHAISPQRISDDADAVFTLNQTQLDKNSTEISTRDNKVKNRLSSMIMGFFRSKKQEQEQEQEQEHGHRKKESRTFSIDENNRGMSPDGFNEEEEKSLESRKQTPRRTPVRRNGYSRNVSGLAICLSPLVRASPNLRCGVNQNRSRKLADFGKNKNKNSYY